MIKSYFRFLRNLREPFIFISKDGEAIPVIMKDYRFIDEPESQYATKISISVQEFIALNLDGSTYEVLNAPTIGSIFGKPSTLASIATKGMSNSIKILSEYLTIKG